MNTSPNRVLANRPPESKRPQTLTIILAGFIVLSIVLGISTFGLNRSNKALIQLRDENKKQLERAEKEKVQLKDAINNYKRENESVLFDLKKAQNQLTAATEEKTYLEELLVSKTKEIETLRSGPIAAGAPGSLADLTQRLKDKDIEITRLKDQNQILTKRLDKISDTMNQKMTEINIAKIALEDTVAKARKSIDAELQTVDLGSIAMSHSKTSAAAAKNAPKTAARKDGRVLAYNPDHDFVIVNLGKVDGITPDTAFLIRKNDQTVATLAVLEIRDVMTACNIKELKQGEKIEINDSVLVQK